MVEQATGQPLPADDDPLWSVPAAFIAARMLTNLKQIYLQDKDFNRAARVLRRLRQLAPGDLGLRRDLGASLLWAGKPGQAIDHLSAYLMDVPDAEDQANIRQLLEEAKSQVARWN
jgi:regulator of sirC expression with transglutaminase-like and TPR domain